MRSLSLLLILGLLFSTAVPALAQDKPVTDDRIHDEVRLKLAGNPDVAGGGIDVEVNQGVVTLRGKVRKDKQKSKAEQLARKVKGVKKVVNQIQAETR